jgi:hypothetical protein
MERGTRKIRGTGETRRRRGARKQREKTDFFKVVGFRFR